MFRKILVAVDGSRPSSRAWEFAEDLSRRYKAPLVSLHAFPPVSDLLGTPQYERVLESRAMIGEQLLASARAQLSEQTPVETQLIEGPPASAILRVAAEDGCDLIQPPCQAGGDQLPFPHYRANLTVALCKIIASVPDLIAPVKRLNELFGSKRNQDAEHDDSDLADECAPAVQWLG